MKLINFLRDRNIDFVDEDKMNQFNAKWKKYIENVLYSSNKNEIYVDDRKIKIKMKKLQLVIKKNFFKFLVFFKWIF